MPAIEPGPLSDFVAGGYFATRLLARPPDCLGGGRVEAKILTVTEHLTAWLPGPWLTQVSGDVDAARRQALERLGIPIERKEEVEAWALSRFGSDWDIGGVCFTPEFAWEVARRFLPRDRDTVVMGLALPSAHASEFLAAARDGVARGVQPDLAGVAVMVAKGRTPAPGGEPLGYDFYRWKYGLECSWLCEEVLADVEADLGVRLNAHGFVASLHAADAVTRWLRNREERGETEPGFWLPFLVLRYR